jgi:hypothetical protein
MLFILAMEPLQRMLSVAASDGLLTPLNTGMASLRISIYADDAAVFLKPIKEEVHVVANILEISGHASGLITNRDECAVYSIQCDSEALQEVMEPFPCSVQSFPSTYLGLPLHFRQPGRL